ncbi:ABC transporter ATP-binding protein [Streptomyces microflavus]|uniref:ABC transporter ATP-binding protein n=1 Tax=Streptomyces microflavus TaxID=1919 RepID=UPI003817C287
MTPGGTRRTIADRNRLLRLLPEAGRVLVGGYAAVLTVQALATPVQAVATAWLVGRIGHPQGAWAIAGPLGALAAVLLASQLTDSLSAQLRASVSARIDGWARLRVREVALAQDGLELLESPGFKDEAALASGLGVAWRVQSPGAAATGQFLLMFRFFGAAAAAGVLASYFPLLAAVLLAVSLFIRAVLRRQWVYLAGLNDSLVGEQRRSEYWADLAAGTAAAKEVRLFGLASWVTTRRQNAYVRPTRIMWQARRDVIRRQGLTTALTAGSALLALGVPGLVAARGDLTVGALAGCLVAAWGVFQIGFMGLEAFDIEAGAGAVEALDRIAGRGAPASVSGHGGAMPRRPPWVRFEGVSFTYPGASEPVLRHLDLEIRPGETLAVVGVNGAGKTTLTKLLGGLYRPTAGCITADGRDLRDLDPAGWRRHLSMVFQDFVRYPATLRDNVALSAPEALDDGEGIHEALRRADAAGLVAGLPDGADTRLWPGGTGGSDLSGGQWQRVVIARALFAAAHGRRLLVLDEPTAHLDVQAEADFYERVVATAGDVSVVIISHRLSTVRRADRIVVLDGGRMTESGSHEELLAHDGRYARLFRLQAARFTDTVAAGDGAPDAQEAVR